MLMWITNEALAILFSACDIFADVFGTFVNGKFMELKSVTSLYSQGSGLGASRLGDINSFKIPSFSSSANTPQCSTYLFFLLIPFLS